MPRTSRWTPILLVGVLIPLGLGVGSWLTQSIHGAPTADVRMKLNGKKYASALGDPTVRLRVTEAGFNQTESIEVFFPLARPGNRGAYGLSITVEPGVVVEGESIFFGSWADDSSSAEARSVRVEYAPFSMADIQAAVELVYGGGGGEIVFDVFEPGLGGTVSGTLVNAELNGVRWSVQDQVVIDPDRELHLEIEGLAFAGTVEEPAF